MKAKKLIIYIFIPLLIGFIGSLLGDSKTGFEMINKPSYSPPGIIFPIVWTILYVLMGISAYIVSESNDKGKNKALVIYGIQLVINMLWTLFFFNLKWYLFSFVWIVILIGFVIAMIYEFYKTSKKAGLLQIPYLIWLIFASILNLSIFILN